MEQKIVKARGAEYREQFAKLPDARGYSIVEMLVILKAYQKYQSDCKTVTNAASWGVLLDYYDIGPGVFHDSGWQIYVSELQVKQPQFWEEINGKIRMSASGRKFVEDNSVLFEYAQDLLPGVTRFPRG